MSGLLQVVTMKSSPRLFPLHVIVIALLSSSLRASQFDDAVRLAIDRGVTALKRQVGDPTGRNPQYGVGASALVGLTLLECGVPANDETVARLVNQVREASPAMNQVYHLALAIMVYDRLGDKQDEPLIQALTVRLLQGQFPQGGWSYHTPAVGDNEVQRLRAIIQQRILKTRPDGTPKPAPLDPSLEELFRRLQQSSPESPPQLAPAQPALGGGGIDNSNTQFAILGLWVARRHGLPVDVALRRAEMYFRMTHTNGTWGYHPDAGAGSRGAMTCAGLLGLAIGTGVVRDNLLKKGPDPKTGKEPTFRDTFDDPLIKVGLKFVSDQLAQTAITGLSSRDKNDLYFLWSIERVAVIYNLTSIYGRDWHVLGGLLILRTQDPATGLWNIHYSPEVDTCFALMFLRKANLARDLTSLLEKRGQSTLRAVGKDDMPNEAEKLAAELKSAPAGRQDQIIEQLRDHKGGEYTDALVRVIPHLDGDVQRKARDALAQRMARMTAATIRSRLRDGNAEMRRAAALACAIKEDKGFIADIISTLDDADARVVRAAAAALRALTGQDFGPAAQATSEERARAIAAWKAWWKRQSGP